MNFAYVLEYEASWEPYMFVYIGVLFYNLILLVGAAVSEMNKSVQITKFSRNEMVIIGFSLLCLYLFPLVLPWVFALSLIKPTAGLIALFFTFYAIYSLVSSFFVRNRPVIR